MKSTKKKKNFISYSQLIKDQDKLEKRKNELEKLLQIKDQEIQAKDKQLKVLAVKWLGAPHDLQHVVEPADKNYVLFPKVGVVKNFDGLMKNEHISGNKNSNIQKMQYL